MNLVEAKTKYGTVLTWPIDDKVYYFRPLTCGELLAIMELQVSKMDTERLAHDVVELCALDGMPESPKVGTMSAIFAHVMRASSPEDTKIDQHYKLKKSGYDVSRVIQMIKPAVEMGLSLNPMEMTINQIVGHVAMIEALGEKKRPGRPQQQPQDDEGNQQPGQSGEVEYDKGKYNEATAKVHENTTNALRQAMEENRKNLVDRIDKKNERVVEKSLK